MSSLWYLGTHNFFWYSNFENFNIMVPKEAQVHLIIRYWKFQPFGTQRYIFISYSDYRFWKFRYLGIQWSIILFYTPVLITSTSSDSRMPRSIWFPNSENIILRFIQRFLRISTSMYSRSHKSNLYYKSEISTLWYSRNHKFISYSNSENFNVMVLKKL